MNTKLLTRHINDLILESYSKLLTEETVDQIYNKYYKGKVYNSAFRYKNQSILYPQSEYGMLETIIDIDPYTKLPNKMGKYSKWLLSVFKNTCLNSSDVKRYMEDGDRITLYLKEFDKLVKKGVIPQEFRNINNCKSYQDLYTRGIEPYQDKLTMDNLPKLEQEMIRDKEAKVVFDGKDWKIVIPETEKASCIFGAGTEWCTASGEYSLNPEHKTYTNRFEQYTEDDSLHIIINKHDPTEKYQLHFYSKQFMDKNDEEVEPVEFLEDPEHKEVRNYFVKDSHEILKFYGVIDYDVQGNGGVIIHSDVEWVGMGLSRLPCKINYVRGDFNLEDNGFESLIGFPEYIGGDFNISSNLLKSLKGSPTEVSGDYICNANKITFLKKDVESVCKVHGEILAGDADDTDYYHMNDRDYNEHSDATNDF